MVNLGPHLPVHEGVVVTSVAWGLAGQVSYVLEGNIHHSGDTLRWLVDDLGLYESMAQWQDLSQSTPSSEGVYLVPAFSGLGAPHWDELARGALVGLVRGTTKAQVARAALESLAYQVVDLLEAMRSASGTSLAQLAVDGGPTRNATLMQFQADVGRVDVTVSATPNASVYGVALMAGLAAGLWPDLLSLRALGNQGLTYHPTMPPGDRERLWSGWQRAVAQTRVKGVR